MNHVIITGADGFVGSNTVNCFINNGIKVLAIDIVDKPRRLKPHDKLHYLKCDVNDINAMSKVLPTGIYDCWIHFAWAGSAGEARTDYNLQTRNALSTVECLKFAKELGCKRFVCAGSIMEREVEAAIHTQGSRPGMGYIYGMGKHIAHCICKSVAANIGIDLLWPMITNAYGAGEFSPRFINTTLRKVINKEPLHFTAATQNYDFVYVTDVAHAFYLVAKDGIAFKEYLIGSGNAQPLREFIKIMQQTVASDAELLFGNVPFTGTNLPLSAFSTAEIEIDCGFNPKVDFATGIRLTMNWLLTL